MLPPDLDPVADALLDVLDRALEPVRVAMAGLQARLEAAEARGRDQAAALAETQSGLARAATGPAGLAETLERGLAAYGERVAVTEARVVALDRMAETLTVLRERVAGLEARPPVPGPAGTPGKDGADGLGFDDLGADLDTETRTLTLRMMAGDRSKTWRFVVPFLQYAGVFKDGTTYAAGECVTWGGSVWTCRETTSSKPGTPGAKGWTLAVKCGRDGKDGKDGPTGPAGPRGRGFEETVDALRAR